MQTGLSWPSAYENLMPLIRNQLGTEGTICLSRELGGGKSGAHVMVADIHCDEYTGQAILKFDKSWYPALQERSEATLLMQAISDAPEFAEQHLPRLLHAFHHESQVAILSTIAGRGLEYADPWTEVPFEQQLSVTKRLSRELFTQWNEDYKLSSGMQMPQDLLASWLDYRLEKSQGGRLEEFLQGECGLEVEELSITFEGHWYPNPLAFVREVVNLPGRLQLRTITGHCHGDLHGLNLLVGQGKSQEPDYFLIDLADYQSNQFLFFDHAYFELSYLLTSREAPDATYWEKILNRLSRSSQPEAGRGLKADDLGLMEIVNGIRTEVVSWIDQQERDRLSYMESQYLLARVAAGMNFTHKKISAQTRCMAYLYAASNLKDYLKLNRLDWPKHGPQFSIFPKSSESASRIRAAEAIPTQRAISTSGVRGSRQDTVTSSRESGRTENSNPIGTFFSELRRRQVIKVAGGYVVAAWLCLQVAISLEASLKLPDWTDSLVATLLVIGFPIACIIAWAFELSPGGMQRTTLAGNLETQPPKHGNKLEYVLGAGILLLLLATVANPIYERFAPANNVVSGNEELKSIAVLPFRNLNDSDEKDSFSDGLTIELISTLARTGEFRVPGQRSSFNYKELQDDLRDIGKKLGVEYILEGSVRKLDDEIRIEAQLVQAEDGFLIWSNVFTETLKDLFKVQQSIAFEIGEALQTPLQIDAASLEKKRTPNAKAYELFLKGIGLYQQRGEEIPEAARMLNESVTIDPDFAAGWAALSLVYDVSPAYVETMDGKPILPSAAYRRAHEFALKAVALDPDLPIVQHAMGNAFRRDRQWAQAEDMYRNALDRKPNEHEVMEDYGQMLSGLGHHEQSIAMAERMLELDPLNALYDYRLREFNWNADPSAENADRVIEFFKKDTPYKENSARIVIGYLTRAGQTETLIDLINECGTCNSVWKDKVLTMIGQVNQEAPETIYDTYRNENFIGYTFLQTIGGADLVLEAFQYFALTSDRSTLNYTIPWPVIDKIGTAEKFKYLVEEEGVLDYWRDRGWPDECRPVSDEDFECSKLASE